MLKFIVFDFDGTLVDSNYIKQDELYNVTRCIPRGKEIIDKIINDPNAGDRYDIFNKFYDKLTHSERKIVNMLKDELVDVYSRQCKEKIIEGKEIEGATRFLLSLRDKGVKLYINSATPETELKEILVNSKMGVLFDGIFGGPSTKIDNMHRVTRFSDYSPSEYLFIGDSRDDLAVANHYGCGFIGITGNDFDINSKYEYETYTNYNEIDYDVINT